MGFFMSLEKNILTNKGSITVRLDTELLQWLKNKADVNGSNISDVIRETILKRRFPGCFS